MNVRSRQLRSELKSITKGNRSIFEYLARIQTIVDVILSIGDSVLHHAYLTGADCSSNQPRNDQIWYPDSGATQHVTNNPSKLLNNISLPRSDQVLHGNGQGLPIISIGSAQHPSPYSPHTTLTQKLVACAC